MPEKQTGFTVVELMIVVTIIAIISSISIPNLLSARIRANEATAIATLKTIASAQIQVCVSASIDVNSNGTGEYGYFGELTGGAGVRGIDGRAGYERLSPPYLSLVFRDVVSRPTLTGGASIVTGYVYQMFLPDAQRIGLPEFASGGVGKVAPDPLQSETFWCCYAWPRSIGSTGQRTFFVNERGSILATRNLVQRYSGLSQAPEFSAAFAEGSGNRMASTIAYNGTGQDGQAWRVIH